MKKLYVSTGEEDGIGLEVFLKSVPSLDLLDKTALIFTANEKALEKQKSFFPDVNIKSIRSSQEIDGTGLFFLRNTHTTTPFKAFEHLVGVCRSSSSNSALVTGPLEKSSFPKGLKGHTQFLQSLFPKSQLFMTFLGSYYNVLLLSEHIPLSSVSQFLNLEKIEEAVRLLKTHYSQKTKDKPIGLLGLNPHAGEGGLIGDEEVHMHSQACEKHSLVGPLSADGFFSIDSYKKYSFLIANYHDQALIPFKMIHGFKACQTSLGLDFVRTSVCHGTAKELFLKNQADETSMLEAIRSAFEMLTTKGENTKNAQ